MQIELKNIYKNLSKNTNISEDLLSAIGSSVFRETLDTIKSPPNLILRLKGVGRWFLRKQQMERKIEYLEEYYKYSTGEIPDPIGKYWENKELKDKLESLLLVYDNYIIEKKVLRDKRKELGFITEIDDIKSLTQDEEEESLDSLFGLTTK
jgi:hypothetical protein